MFITVHEGIIRHELPFTEGETVLTVMQNGGIESITASCGGKGACKKCSVYIKSDDFTGEALSCVTEAREGMSVEIESETRFSFAHRKNAALLGIIPQECVDRSEKLGNTALAGAISAALSEKARNELSRLQKIVSAVDLSTHSSFSTEFMDAMTFE